MSIPATSIVGCGLFGGYTLLQSNLQNKAITKFRMLKLQVRFQEQFGGVNNPPIKLSENKPLNNNAQSNVA